MISFLSTKFFQIVPSSLTTHRFVSEKNKKKTNLTHTNENNKIKTQRDKKIKKQKLKQHITTNSNKIKTKKMEACFVLFIEVHYVDAYAQCHFMKENC